ncbi:hypothetical protein CF326_g9661 [Tilletia indica]|nr:hypothetical protein CF326_g9661 [Tilletia indica]
MSPICSKSSQALPVQLASPMTARRRRKKRRRRSLKILALLSPSRTPQSRWPSRIPDSTRNSRLFLSTNAY